MDETLNKLFSLFSLEIDRHEEILKICETKINELKKRVSELENENFLRETKSMKKSSSHGDLNSLRAK